MTANVDERMAQALDHLEASSRRVLSALDYVMSELQTMATEGDDPPSPIALSLLRGIRERLEGRDS